jgi:serine/threonine-protein kinase
MVRECVQCGQVHDAYTSCTLSIHSFGRPTLVGEDEALVGSVVADRYRIGDILGQGVTGTVFAVEHVSFGRPAVMKVLRPRFADEDLVSRVFHGEARAAWSVTHPCLCEVFDIGALPDGAPFCVMERLEGETLAARIARERLSLAAAVDVVMQILSAIATVHARDLLLRDLRPQNVLLAHRRGCRPLVKILDFGLARLTSLELIQREWEASPDADGARTGSCSIPYYLSPERARGENSTEPASDLFVAAVILYEALAGERPFTAPSFEGILRQICQGRPVPLHERRPDVPVELSAFVSRALSANPRARPASAKDMQDELRAIFENVRRPSTALAPAADAAPTEAQANDSTMASIATSPLSLAPRRPGSRPDIAPVTAATTSARPGDPDGDAPFAPDLTRPRFEHIYVEQTETRHAKRSMDDALPPFGVVDVTSDSFPEDADDSVRIVSAVVDEASAEAAERTVPPPPATAREPSTGVDLLSATAEAPSLDETAEKTIAKRTHERKVAEDEVTETMQLRPELRARIEELMGGAPPSRLPPLQPPPAKKRPKPPRR